MNEPDNSREWWTVPKYQLLLLLAAGGVIALATVVIARGDAQPNTLEYDARKHAIQFLLLTGLGAVVAFLVDLERRVREAREQRRTFETQAVSSMLELLDAIYANVKNVRRMLRVDEALGELDDPRLGERMACLNREQTRAEQLRKRMVALDSQVPGLAAIATDLEGVDNYLSRYWGCYEDAPIPGSWLKGFVASAKSGESDFKPDFQTHYDNARMNLIRMLGRVSTEAR